jgi:ribosomal protein S18
MHEPIGFKHDELSDAQLQDEVEEAYEGDDDDDDDDENGDEDAWRRKSSNVIVRNAIVSSDIADHLDKFSSGGVRQQGILPQEFLNYNMPWRESDESTDPHLDSFVPHTSPARFTHDSQGLKSCPGKRQRRGTQPKLECHILDLDDVNHLDVVSLRRFISTDCEILSRKATGLCAKCQRKVCAMYFLLSLSTFVRPMLLDCSTFFRCVYTVTRSPKQSRGADSLGCCRISETT